jgi:hypothetical protein
VAFRGWDEEVAHLLLKELDAKLSPLGYHVALPGGRRMASLELMVFPAVAEKDRGGIAAALRASELQLAEKKKSLKRVKKFFGMTLREVEVWTHGRGKSERRIQLFTEPA